MSRSPGNSSLVTSARSSNNDGVTVPALTSLRMVGARSVVIQRSPSTPSRSSRMRAAVSIPRSPTSTTCCKPNRSRIFATWLATVSGSAVEPSKTSTATGQPSAVHSSPKTICSVPFLPSRLSNGLLAEDINPGLRKMADATTMHRFCGTVHIARWHVEGDAFDRALAQIHATDGRLPDYLIIAAWSRIPR